MIIKKISIQFSSGFITPLESDTLIGYVFSNYYNDLEVIAEGFIRGEIPFIITNGFKDGFFPKPIIFKEIKEIKNKSLDTVLKEERDRKKNKSVDLIPIELFIKYINSLKSGVENDINTMIIKKIDENEVKYMENFFETKNTITRNTNIATPYGIANVNYSTGKYVFYVKIFNEELFNKFYLKLEYLLKNIGWGKAKSRGYGTISSIDINEINENEKEVFQYIESLKREGKYLILNNYFPTKDELEKIDGKNSKIQILEKQGKGGTNIFKGTIRFITSSSVVLSDDELKGGIVQGENFFNIGYLF